MYNNIAVTTISCQSVLLSALKKKAHFEIQLSNFSWIWLYEGTAVKKKMYSWQIQKKKVHASKLSFFRKAKPIPYIKIIEQYLAIVAF